MKNMINLTLIFLLSWACFGCANSSITVSLDIYKDDPVMSTPLTFKETSNYRVWLDTYEQQTIKIVSSRKSALDKMKTSFNNFSGVSLSTRTKFATLIQQYDEQLRDKSTQAFTDHSTARVSLNKYIIKIDPANQSPVVKDWSLAQLRITLESALNIATNSFDNLKRFPSTLKSSMRDINQYFDKSYFNNLKTRWNVTTVPAEITSTYRDYFQSQRKLDLITTAQLEDKVAASGGVYVKEISDSFGDATELADRNSLLSSQLDRLQNYADPVWREITSVNNADKWTPTFAQTKFFAEGESEVVIVRDNPGSYRIHQGSNNPAALIQSQLQITRAIGNTALAIASAASGSPLPISLPGASNTLQVTDDESTSLAKSRELQIQTDQRKINAAYLKQELKTIFEKYSDIALLAKTDPKFVEFENRFKAYLAAGVVLLKQ